MSFSTDRLNEIQETIWEPFDEYESKTRATQEQLKKQRLNECTYPVDKMRLEEVVVKQFWGSKCQAVLTDRHDSIS